MVHYNYSNLDPSSIVKGASSSVAAESSAVYVGTLSDLITVAGGSYVSSR